MLAVSFLPSSSTHSLLGYVYSDFYRALSGPLQSHGLSYTPYFLLSFHNVRALNIQGQK